jgi:hypothetical protein
MYVNAAMKICNIDNNPDNNDLNKKSYDEQNEQIDDIFWDNFCADENNDRIECRIYDV